jgi:hypothetical protein
MRIKYINVIIEKKYKIFVVLFFVAYLFIGLLIVGDYGISWDETTQRDYGKIVFKYIWSGDLTLLSNYNRYHGPFFTTFLYHIEKAFNLTDNTRASYIMRHIATFLLFYTSVFFFYKIIKYKFKSWKLGLLGSLFLILSPRIFAHSFYNPKDIPFLSMFIICSFTLIRFLNKKSYLSSIMHSLTCAILIDIRILGIVIILITIIFYLLDICVIKKDRTKKSVISLIIFIILFLGLTILFWPVLWENPINHFFRAFSEMSSYPWGGAVLYLGKYIIGTDIQWHYIPVWISITTPFLYLICFLAGCFYVIRQIINSSRRTYIENRDNAIFILSLFIPLSSVIIFKSVLYDSWRQMFFIYPAFLFISILGLNSLWKTLKKNLKERLSVILRVVLTFLIIISLVNTLYFMIKYHPYQNIYFNQLAGRNMQIVKSRFDLDYWGLSYRKALEYILENDSREEIKIYVENLPGFYNSYILPEKDKKRLIYVKKPEEADYFLSNYRWHKDDYPYENEFYSIEIDGAKIMVVYKLF